MPLGANKVKHDSHNGLRLHMRKPGNLNRRCEHPPDTLHTQSCLNAMKFSFL